MPWDTASMLLGGGGTSTYSVSQNGSYTFNYTAVNTGNVTLQFKLLNTYGGIAWQNNYYLDDVKVTDITTNNAPLMLAHKDYYPFGMPMPERNIEGEYHYAYQGQEKDAETGMEAFELRLWDSRIGRWLTTDPAGQFSSPYLGMGNNPISRVDPDGGFSPPSTGVTDNGDGTYTVVGARNDGDTGIYIVDGNGNWDINTSQMIGNTLNAWDFLDTNDATGKFKDALIPVTFSFENLESAHDIYSNITGNFKDLIASRGYPQSTSALALLAGLSRNGGIYDIKAHAPLATGGKFTPVSLGDNYITTTRSLGNIIFEANMRTVSKYSWDALFTTHERFYKDVMPWAGAYNQRQNNGNGYNSGYPFYGEHTYSGTNIFYGFFGRKPN